MPHTGTHAMDSTMRDAMLTTEYTELYYVDQSSPTAERALNGNSKVHSRHHGLASDSDVSVCPRYGPDPRGKTGPAPLNTVHAYGLTQETTASRVISPFSPLGTRVPNAA